MTMINEKSRLGLECPKCGCRHFRVIYTRPKKAQIIRRKECRYCGWRVLTREQIGARIPYL